MESPRGKVRIEVKTESDQGRKLITLKPKDVQIVETLISNISGDVIQLVTCYGMAHPYRIEVGLEEWDTLIAKAEQEVKEDEQ